nr:molybdate ABC transporter substrate-binding protein [uncultured Dysosmobacter sp.]
MKKLFSLILALCLLLSLAACGQQKTEEAPPAEDSGTEEPAAEPVELTVFAAASMTETMDQIIALYQDVAPNVTITPTYDSSGTLLDQIQQGADCDLFISAGQSQMNTLDEEGALLAGSRLDLLENKVTLSVPEGNPKGIESFDQLAELLKSGDVFLAIGDSSVPVGQYTQKIFAYYGIDEAAIANCLTYGSNVKEVTTQVSEATVDCGIIYGTDAFSAGLAVVDSATAEMCGQVIYPAAVLAESQSPEAARAFLDYLTGAEASAVFEGVGFSPLS